VLADAGGRVHPVATMATQQYAGGRWIVVSFWCPSAAVPVPDTAALRERTLRLLPHVGIGHTDARSLVHIQTLLWAQTAPTRSLGTPRILGTPIHLRIHLHEAHWDFGDGQHDTRSGPDAAYPSRGTCHTVTCPGYYGHTYTHTGAMTITLTLTWSAEYSLDATHYHPIASTPLPGPPTRLTLDLNQARATLIPNPTP
jgi:hypothetical protein